MKDKWIVGVTGGLWASLVLMLVSCGNAQQVQVPQVIEERELDLVTVSGKSEVKVVPDKASIQAGFTIRNSSVDEIVGTLNNRVSALTSRLTLNGIKETEIVTEYYDVRPEYRWVEDERRQIGYVGDTSITISGIDIDKMSTILKLVTDSGVESVGNISYYSSEYKSAYDDALGQAISEARSKADKMGDVAGFEVVRVHEMQEGRQNDSMAYVTNSVKGIEMADSYSADGGSAIAPGELVIEASVEVTYVIE